MTAKFREFYVSAGAGSNFLASKCLWANDIENARFADGSKGHSIPSNEFFFPRVKIGKEFKNKKLIPLNRSVKKIRGLTNRCKEIPEDFAAANS